MKPRVCLLLIALFLLTSCGFRGASSGVDGIYNDANTFRMNYYDYDEYYADPTYVGGSYKEYFDKNSKKYDRLLKDSIHLDSMLAQPNQKARKRRPYNNYNNYYGGGAYDPYWGSGWGNPYWGLGWGSYYGGWGFPYSPYFGLGFGFGWGSPYWGWGGGLGYYGGFYDPFWGGYWGSPYYYGYGDYGYGGNYYSGAGRANTRRGDYNTPGDYYRGNSNDNIYYQDNYNVGRNRNTMDQPAPQYNYAPPSSFSSPSPVGGGSFSGGRRGGR